MTDKKYHTIIVGAGMAGLTCGAYLSKEGRNVLLVEKNKECGGLVNSFADNGFLFDTGIRAFENAGIIFPMLKELEIKLDLLESHVSVGIEDEILNIEDVNSLLGYGDMLKKLYPESCAEIDQVIKLIRRIMRHMDVLYGIDNPNFKNLKSDRSYLFGSLLPWLPKFLLTLRKINSLNVPVEPYLGKIIKNRSLRDIISQHFFRNTPAFFALSYFSLYLDYFYPAGGTGKLPEAIERRFLESGGEIKRETSIKLVEPSRKRVIDDNNSEYYYENLVWAADLKTLYRITTTEGMSEIVRRTFQESGNWLLEKRGGDSVFTMLVETDEPPASFKKISRGHFFYTPSRVGLGETRWGDLDMILKRKGGADKTLILEWLNKFLALNTYEISIPALRDPSLSPEGKTGLVISFLADYDLFRAVDIAGWLREFTSETEKHVISILAGSVYPMLKDKVTRIISFSPLSYEKRVGSSDGAITGWSFREPVPVVNKMLDAGKAVLTPIPSIYQAGQWTYSPAGVPMAILTGKLAARAILDDRSAR